MGRIEDAFAVAKREKRAALVIYLCGGDPSLEATQRLIIALADAGADVIELGMPFSDPTADGPAIQKASERALAAGTTLPKLLDLVREVRAAGCEVPILLFGYYNPILRYGEARLAADAKAAGVDGFLVVDLPPEEAPVLVEPLRAEGLAYVPLVAPTSDEARVAAASRLASGFVYYVSMTGVTGAKATQLTVAAERAAELSGRLGVPVAVGFGVKSAADAAEVAAHADGVVVGSAVVRAIEAAESDDAAVEAASSLVASLARGVRDAAR